MENKKIKSLVLIVIVLALFLDKALGKYINAGKLWNKVASDLISGSVSGVVQKIIDYSKIHNNG
jgi:hypothetical protein